MIKEVIKYSMSHLSSDIADIQNTIYLIYDDDCILCRQTAKALRLKKAVGNLQTINARTEHPLVYEAIKKGYDLNAGIIVIYNNTFYHGAEAVNLLALLSSPVGLFNRLNAWLFKYKLTTTLCYPLMVAVRNALLFIRGIPQIESKPKQPIFATAFGAQWQDMPKMLKYRYGNYALQNQSICIKGVMNIYVSRFFNFLSPLLRLTGTLVPYAGRDIPVTVELTSRHNSQMVYMQRNFYYPNNKQYQFKSRLLVTKKGHVIELMRFGFGVCMQYDFSADKVHIKHRSYIWRILGCNIPMPLALLFGKVHGHEISINSHRFSMLVAVQHLFLGKMFSYDGVFEKVEPE